MLLILMRRLSMYADVKIQCVGYSVCLRLSMCKKLGGGVLPYALALPCMYLCKNKTITIRINTAGSCFLFTSSD